MKATQRPALRYAYTQEHLIWALLVADFFAAGYFGIPRLLEGHPGISLATRLDDLIPYEGWAALPYTLGYLFVFLPALFFPELPYFRRGALALLFVMAVCFGFFLAFPVRFPPPEPRGFWDSLLLPRIPWLADQGWNAFPSLHVALASAAWAALLRISKPVSLLATILWALIFASTVLLKRHFFLDALAGLALGLAAHFWIVEPEFQRRKVRWAL